MQGLDPHHAMIRAERFDRLNHDLERGPGRDGKEARPQKPGAVVLKEGRVFLFPDDLLVDLSCSSSRSPRTPWRAACVDTACSMSRSAGPGGLDLGRAMSRLHEHGVEPLPHSFQHVSGLS